jgi:deazaflavin-dependent oxidoreductase (nitroreductase family)
MNKLRDPGFQRSLFRRVNVVMLLMWRLGLGRIVNAAPSITGRVMVIVTTGRRTGRVRRFPVTYAPADGHLHCLAGFGANTHWYRNVLAHPDVELWMPGGRWRGHAEPLPTEGNLSAVRDVFKASAFASTVFEGINASTVSDDELRAMAVRFPLVRITLTERVQGPRYADLAWIWPVAAAAILLAGAIRARHHLPSANE